MGRSRLLERQRQRRWWMWPLERLILGSIGFQPFRRWWQRWCWHWCITTLWIWVLREWHAGNKLGGSLWITNHRETCVWVVRRKCRLWFSTVLLVVLMFNAWHFLFLFTAGYWHPLVDFHRCLTNRHPFLLPKSHTETDNTRKMLKGCTYLRIEMNIQNGCNFYQWRTRSTACITRLISSLARLLVSARTDLDILIQFPNVFTLKHT